MRRRADRSVRIAAAQRRSRPERALRLQRVGDGDGRRLLLDVDLRQPGCAPRLVAVRATTANTAWPWNIDLARRRSSGSSAKTGRDVVLAGNVGRGQHRDNAGRRAHRAEIEARHHAAGPVRHADGDMQRPLGLADVVDIGRRALHVQPSGIVRQRLVNDRSRSGEFRHIIRRHGALRSGSARSRRQISISALSHKVRGDRQAIAGARALIGERRKVR